MDENLDIHTLLMTYTTNITNIVKTFVDRTSNGSKIAACAIQSPHTVKS